MVLINIPFFNFSWHIYEIPRPSIFFGSNPWPIDQGFICWGRGQEAQPGAVRAYLGQVAFKSLGEFSMAFFINGCKWGT
jgi:hypothetical protein